ncbi:Hsp20/alpha crystallin family protein [Actinomycetospora straminea]|uniref:SHSP domain-containing protein n=1 Tax=Actinomycetospora straminea TaxID=663607 RepID=A0ABP9EKQ0_9PSEU|nr:Hsp20/alpha crystallin family protein [Actinomycetospora straminea]MDD7933154.1 Hsp20/alpha crystallin family protein [Actinomycetospora straminea]
MATTTRARRNEPEEPAGSEPTPATVTTDAEATSRPASGVTGVLSRGARAVVETLGAPVADSLLGRHPRSTGITTDERVEEGALVVEAELPGFAPDAITVAAEGGELFLRAQREIEPGTGRLQRRERRTGTFARDLVLPPGTDPTTITATYADGVLTVRVPLPEPSPSSRRVEIPVRHRR